MKFAFLLLSLYGCTAFAAGQFQTREDDYQPPGQMGEVYTSMQKTMCHQKAYAIVYHQGGYQMGPPIVDGLCSWERRANVGSCLDLSKASTEERHCWNAAIAFYQLDKSKVDEAPVAPPVIEEFQSNDAQKN